METKSEFDKVIHTAYIKRVHKNELSLFKAYGLWLDNVTENCNSITEFYNDKRGLNQPAFKEKLVARGRFELPSAGPEPAMLDLYIRWKELNSIPPPGFWLCLRAEIKIEGFRLNKFQVSG